MSREHSSAKESDQHKSAEAGATQHGQSTDHASHAAHHASAGGHAAKAKRHHLSAKEQRADEKRDYEKRVAHFKACQDERDFNISKHIPTKKCKRPASPGDKDNEEVAPRKSLPLVTTEEFEAYTFEYFVQDFKRPYHQHTAWWKNRQQTFDINMKALMTLRKQKRPKGWSAGITMFMDYNIEEYEALLGLKVDRRGRAGNSSGNSSIYAQALTQRTYEEVQAEVSVVHRDMPLSTFIREQGSCGSCWAAAAMSTLEGAVMKNIELRAMLAGRATALQSPMQTLSTEAVVSCTQNPRSCGGTGGCGGATVEMAFEMVKAKGVPLAAEWGYTSGRTGNQENCDPSHFQTPLLITMDSYKVLPSNDLAGLLGALVELGHPVAVSVDATNWRYYAGGIYSDLDVGYITEEQEDGGVHLVTRVGDFTINHAVTLMGYRKPTEDNVSKATSPSDEILDSAGSDNDVGLVQKGRRQPPDTNPRSRGYYLLKNSWGPWFGESGFIRIEMKKNEAEHCGWDTEAHKGVACEGDPEKAWVCGTCGILYDSVYPEGIRAIKSSVAPQDAWKPPAGPPGGGRKGQGKPQTETGLSRGANWKE